MFKVSFRKHSHPNPSPFEMEICHPFERCWTKAFEQRFSTDRKQKAHTASPEHCASEEPLPFFFAAAEECTIAFLLLLLSCIFRARDKELVGCLLFSASMHRISLRYETMAPIISMYAGDHGGRNLSSSAAQPLERRKKKTSSLRGKASVSLLILICRGIPQRTWWEGETGREMCKANVHLIAARAGAATDRETDREKGKVYGPASAISVVRFNELSSAPCAQLMLIEGLPRRALLLLTPLQTITHSRSVFSIARLFSASVFVLAR